MAVAIEKTVAWRRREKGGGWQYFGWAETGMTHELVARWNSGLFECEATPVAPPAAARVPLTLTDEQIDALLEAAD